jgi:NADP-dependent 3-hydroxy acid dehydrogenase YdfG
VLETEGAELILTGRRVDQLQSMAHKLGARFVAADLSRPVAGRCSYGAGELSRIDDG